MTMHYPPSQEMMMSPAEFSALRAENANLRAGMQAIQREIAYRLGSGTVDGPDEDDARAARRIRELSAQVARLEAELSTEARLGRALRAHKDEWKAVAEKYKAELEKVKSQNTTAAENKTEGGTLTAFESLPDDFETGDY